MATLDHQHSPFPSSGNTLTHDGAPLHSRLGIDLLLGCNNLTYTYPHFGSVAGDVEVYNYSRLAAEEKFAIQVPVVLPADGVRFCWTLGLDVDNYAAYDMVLDTVSLYLAPAPYTGDDYSEFDAADMGAPYASLGEANVSLTVGTGDKEYVFIDQSAGTTGLWLPSKWKTEGGLISANLIFTTTGYIDDSEGELHMRFHDFSWWVNQE